METTLNTDGKVCRIIVEKGVLCHAYDFIKPVMHTNELVIITDENVRGLYLDALMKSIDRSAKVVNLTVKGGEESKSLTEYGRLLGEMAQFGVTRGATVVALGGGVVGDLSGFIASTYMRGLSLVQIPTTLLAGIDSSVGGKTAVNLEQGKNLVGTFYQPSVVLYDTDTLATLPERELLNGYGELVKYGILTGGKLYEILKGGKCAFLERVEECVSLCVDYKRSIVEKDEKEGGVRRLLNLGHTFAHGIEKSSGFTVPHGAAVGRGIRIIVRACAMQQILSSDVEAQNLLDLFGLPKVDEDLSELCRLAAIDKKTEGRDINLVTVHGIGDCRCEKIALDRLEDFVYGR